MRCLAILQTLLILGGCATTTLLEGQWRAPDSELKPYGSIAVLTINDTFVDREAVRRKYRRCEDTMSL